MITIFDDLQAPLFNLLDLVKPGGIAYLVHSLNEDPVDVIMRYRDASNAQNGYQSGWNIFSRQTYEDLFEKYPAGLERVYREFRMPIPIHKRSDPMRAWTIPGAGGKRFQLINGACQLINPYLIRVRKP